jgi:hypothetical protein
VLERRQRTELPLPTPDEQLVAHKVLGVCMHRVWTRSIEKYAQFANCVRCGDRLFLSGNNAPELSDAAVCELWLKQLPRSATDEVAANAVLRKLEAEGWAVKIIQSGDMTACVLQKEHAKFESSAHKLRAAAINEAAAKAAARNCSGLEKPTSR